MVAVFKNDTKGYIIHPFAKTVSGFNVAIDPFIRLSIPVDDNKLTSAIKYCLGEETKTPLPDPTDWSSFNKSFLRKIGFSSLKELHNGSTIMVDIWEENGKLLFMPTRNAAPPGKGFSHKPDETISIPANSPVSEFVSALNSAFQLCS